MAVIIGDSTHNTLSAVRSLGEARVPFALVLKCDEYVCYVTKSRYLRRREVHRISRMEECLPILRRLAGSGRPGEQTLMCTFDEAAVFVDRHEEELSRLFKTPLRGGRLGELFDKDAQCRLAAECGLTVPKSRVFHRGVGVDPAGFDFPVLLKPLNSTTGEKGDIHICRSREEIATALKEESCCSDFIMQEFIEKEYEINCLGVRTEEGVYIPGGVRKQRHYPKVTGACSFGRFIPAARLGTDLRGVDRFLAKAGYHGPFSVEFLHRGGKDYFMEVNFRNDGLAYAATAAGANLHAICADPSFRAERRKVRPVYMMNYSIDLLYVKDGSITVMSWLRDFLRTRCFININIKDLKPVVCYYKDKIIRKLSNFGGGNTE